jgi:hypothetical protein
MFVTPYDWWCDMVVLRDHEARQQKRRQKQQSLHFSSSRFLEAFDAPAMDSIDVANVRSQPH